MDAREYFRIRKNSIYEDSYQQELKAHRRRRLIIISTLLSLLIATCLIVWAVRKNQTFDSYEIVSQQAREDSEATTYLGFQGNLLKYNMDGIACIGRDYKQRWNQAYEMKNPVLDSCGKYAAVCDEDGTKVYIFSPDGLSGEVETKLPIKKISVSGQGTVAVLMEDETVNYIDYYDKEGELLAENKAPIEKSGFPLDLDLSEDGYKMAVSYMLVENISINTKLAFYNFDSVGENEIDHLVSAANYDGSIVPNVEFLNKDTAVAFGDTFFEIYEGTQKPKSIFKKELQSEINSVFYNENYFGFVFNSSESSQPYKMQVFNLKGKLLFEQTFDFQYDSIKMGEDGIYMYNDGMCRIYNLKGKQIYEGGFDNALETVIPITKRKLMAVCSGELLFVRLK